MAWENSSAVAAAIVVAVAHLGFDRIGFDRIGFDRIGFDIIGFDRIAHFQKMLLFFAQQMNQELIKAPCFQKNVVVFCPKNESGVD